MKKFLVLLLVAVTVFNFSPLQSVSAKLHTQEEAEGNSYHFKKGKNLIHINVGEDYVVSVINNKTGQKEYLQVTNPGIVDPIIKFYTRWNDLGITDGRQKLTKKQQKQLATITGVREGYVRINVFDVYAQVLVGNGVLPYEETGDIGDKFYVKYYGDEGDKVISYKSTNKKVATVNKKGKVTLKGTNFNPNGTFKAVKIAVKVKKADGTVVKYYSYVNCRDPKAEGQN